MSASTSFDRVCGSALVALGTGAALEGHGLQVAFAADPIGPKAFPIIVGGILAFCGGCIALRPAAIEWKLGDYGRVALIALAGLLYPFILVPIGFVPATALLGFASAMAFKGRLLPSLLASAIMAGLIFAIVDLGLGLGLPRGPVGF